MQTGTRVYIALFLLSLGALTAEVAMTRLFSFSLWYHFAYMTIGVALLGYGAAGSAYFAFPEVIKDGVARALGRWALLGAAFLVACLMIVSYVPFDPAVLFKTGQFNWQTDPRQFFYLAIYYVAVIAPFFAVGLCITILFRNAPGRIAQLYFADLIGAAGGCVVAVSLLTPIGAPGLVVLGAGLVAVSALLFVWPERSLRGRTVAVGIAIAAFGIPLSRVADVKPSDTKWVSMMLSRPEVRVLFKRWSPVYRVDVLGGSDSKPLRDAYYTAWGVSGNYKGEYPENLMITHDGDAATMMYRFKGDFDEFAFLDHSLLKLPYLFIDRPEVLIIGVGGGVDVLTALKNQAPDITGIELNRVTVSLLKERLTDYNGNVFNRPEVRLVVDEGRNYVRRGEREYDLIQLTGIDTLAAIYSGAYVLSESYLYTVEAVEEYLQHLTPRGVFAMVRGDWMFRDVPPMQIIRFLSAAVEAYRRMGVDDPSRYIVVAMSHPPTHQIPTFSVMLARSPFDEGVLATLKAHMAAEGFEPWHVPGMQLATPAGEYLSKTAAEREQYLSGHWLNMAAATDDKPFFFNFFKWGELIRALNPRSDYTPAAGQLVLGAILVQSIVFAFLLIVLPLLRVRPASGLGSGLRFLVYFACLGLGFIFIEISYIQRFTLFLGSPVFSLSVILASLLFFSGTGSYLSGQLRILANTSAALRRLLIALCVLNVVYALGLQAIFGVFLGTPLAVRIAVAVLLLAPAGLVMGAFLPVGMRVLGSTAPDLIPWAWAANGVMSVVGSTLCIVLAISVGFQVVNLIALGVYMLGVAALLRPARLVSQAT